MIEKEKKNKQIYIRMPYVYNSNDHEHTERKIKTDVKNLVSTTVSSTGPACTCSDLPVAELADFTVPRVLARIRLFLISPMEVVLWLKINCCCSFLDDLV